LNDYEIRKRKIEYDVDVPFCLRCNDWIVQYAVSSFGAHAKCKCSQWRGSYSQFSGTLLPNTLERVNRLLEDSE